MQCNETLVCEGPGPKGVIPFGEEHHITHPLSSLFFYLVNKAGPVANAC